MKFNQYDHSNSAPLSKTYGDFFNSFFKLSNICGGTQILEMVIFKDISVVSEPILIKQRWFCHLNCMFFQIWHLFHYLTKTTELNYPFNFVQVSCSMLMLTRWSLASTWLGLRESCSRCCGLSSSTSLSLYQNVRHSSRRTLRSYLWSVCLSVYLSPCFISSSFAYGPYLRSLTY